MVYGVVQLITIMGMMEEMSEMEVTAVAVLMLTDTRRRSCRQLPYHWPRRTDRQTAIVPAR